MVMSEKMNPLSVMQKIEELQNEVHKEIFCPKCRLVLCADDAVVMLHCYQAKIMARTISCSRCFDMHATPIIKEHGGIHDGIVEFKDSYTIIVDGRLMFPSKPSSHDHGTSTAGPTEAGPKA